MDFVTYAAPSADRRWRIVEATMRRHGHQSHALIETLHTVQEAFGYLDKAALQYVAAALRVPLSRAYGVATFYHLFNLKPQGSTPASYVSGPHATSKALASIAGGC